jgi:hypothetical protein
MGRRGRGSFKFYSDHLGILGYACLHQNRHAMTVLNRGAQSFWRQGGSLVATGLWMQYWRCSGSHQVEIALSYGEMVHYGLERWLAVSDPHKLW